MLASGSSQQPPVGKGYSATQHGLSVITPAACGVLPAPVTITESSVTELAQSVAATEKGKDKGVVDVDVLLGKGATTDGKPQSTVQSLAPHGPPFGKDKKRPWTPKLKLSFSGGWLQALAQATRVPR